MKATRQRASSKRSRAGCRTCRIRHVKCDETPVSCKNCAAVGWKCEGYENRLAHPRKGAQVSSSNAPSLSLARIATPLPGGSSDERRGFDFFQRWTVPEMTSLFDTRLWNHLVLPMSHAERAVAHAVVALSTLHEDMKARGAPLSRENLSNDRHVFALEQYTRALSSLNIRRHSKDPKLREVLLTCCLLFVFFELLRGQYDPAFAHLQWGLAIIKQTQKKSKKTAPKKTSPAQSQLPLPSPSPSPSPPPLPLSTSKRNDDNSTAEIETSLVESMSRLNSQSTFFGIDVAASEPIMADHIPKEEDSNECSYDEFETISEARIRLDGLFDKACRIVGAFAWLPAEEQLLESNRVTFRRRQKEMRKEYANWMSRINRSEPRLVRVGGKAGERAIAMLRLYHRTNMMMVETFIEQEHVSYDAYMDEFKKLVSTCEQIANTFGADATSRPTLLSDVGVIPALFYVCLKCPDASLRRQALSQLEAWPHREGPWDSNLLAIMSSQVLQVETEAEMQKLSEEEYPRSSPEEVTYISRSSRIVDPSMEVKDDQTSAVLRYSTKECTPRETRERLVVFE